MHESSAAAAEEQGVHQVKELVPNKAAQGRRGVVHLCQSQPDEVGELTQEACAISEGLGIKHLLQVKEEKLWPQH